MASGDLLAVFYGYDDEPILGGVKAVMGWRNQHYVLSFNDTADRETVFSSVMPQNYSGGGITIYIHYSMATATTEEVVWQTAFERIGDGQLDVDSDSFTAFLSSGQVTVPGTAGHVDIASIAHTNGSEIDSIAVSELFRFKLRRDADSTSATDDAAGNAELHFVELRET